MKPVNPLKTCYYWYIHGIHPCVFPPKYSVLVGSHGGVATTSLMEFFSDRIQTNNPYDRDHIKHLPAPPRWVSHDTKVIYIYGEPCAAALSLFRRGYASIQSCKNGVFNGVREGEDLKTYINIGKDRLGLTSHLMRWSRRPQHMKVGQLMLVKYSSLWDSLEEIASFVGVSYGDFSAFPKMKERVSGIDLLTNEDAGKLFAIYDRYLNIEQNLPDVFIL